jgi:hypothetical protein
VIVRVPAHFTATTISAVSAADDIVRYVYDCVGCSTECGRCVRTIDTIVDEVPAYAARAYGAGLSRSLDRARCYQSVFFERSRYLRCLLLLKSPTPRARTYADRPSELSREVTLIAEAALRRHIGERQPVIAQFLLG